MSANIPEHMLLSDLLKATGYNCPSNLQGKTFKEATAGVSPSELEDNKAVTIDASTYTQPVEVTPTEGKEGMKKCTVTLENIPQAGAILYAFTRASGPSSATIIYASSLPEEDTAEIDVYIPSANTGLSKTTGSYDKANSTVYVQSSYYTRNDAGDITL